MRYLGKGFYRVQRERLHLREDRHPAYINISQYIVLLYLRLLKLSPAMWRNELPAAQLSHLVPDPLICT